MTTEVLTNITMTDVEGLNYHSNPKKRQKRSSPRPQKWIFLNPPLYAVNCQQPIRNRKLPPLASSAAMTTTQLRFKTAKNFQNNFSDILMP